MARVGNLPLLCVYSDCGQVVNTYFPTVDEYNKWKDSAFEYGLEWSHLIDRNTGTILECDFSE